MDIEQFLDVIYKTEIEFQIDKEEVDFIQTGIETLVQIIADLIWEHAYMIIENETENVMQKFSGLQISRNGKYAINDIIKAGSFYEGTKNVYPDQFDFIFLMRVFESRKFVKNEDIAEVNVSELHNICRDILSSSEIAFPTLDERKRCIRFDRYLERKGPISKLRFIYECNKKEKYIYVDLVPAFKVLLLDNAEQVVDKCEIPRFKEEVKRTGSIILVQHHVSFVETELNFMKFNLSSNHVKAYRVLKFIMNGSYNNENVRSRFNSEFWSVFTKSTPRLVSSYHMKRVVISHHYECINGKSEDVAFCLISMMEDLKSVKSIVSVKKLYELFLGHPFILTGYRIDLLENMIIAFKAIQQRSKKTNDYSSGLPVKQSWQNSDIAEIDSSDILMNEKPVLNSYKEDGQGKDKQNNFTKPNNSIKKHDSKIKLFGQTQLRTTTGKNNEIVNATMPIMDDNNFRIHDLNVLEVEKPLRSSPREIRDGKDKLTNTTILKNVNLNDSDYALRQPTLVQNHRVIDDRNDKTVSDGFQINNSNLPLEHPVVNISRENNKWTNSKTRITNISSFRQHDPKVLPQEEPLLDSPRENDLKWKKTKASDWIKTITTYLTNLILILMCISFAVLILYTLSH